MFSDRNCSWNKISIMCFVLLMSVARRLGECKYHCVEAGKDRAHYL